MSGQTATCPPKWTVSALASVSEVTALLSSPTTWRSSRLDRPSQHHRRRHTRNPRHAHPPVGHRRARDYPALPGRRQPAISLRREIRERSRRFHRKMAGLVRRSLAGSIRANRRDLLGRRRRSRRMARPQWPCARLAAIFQRQVRCGPARCGACRARDMGRQLC